MSTIQMSHGFAFSFPIFKHEVLRLLPQQRAEEDIGEGRFKQPGWPAVAEEGRRGRPRPRLALSRPELATGGMATKLPWADGRPWL